MSVGVVIWSEVCSVSSTSMISTEGVEVGVSVGIGVRVGSGVTVDSRGISTRGISGGTDVRVGSGVEVTSIFR